MAKNGKATATAVIDHDDDPSDEIPEDELTADEGFAKFIDKSDPSTTVVTFRDVRFSFPASRAAWPTKAMQMFQRRQHADGVELLFGEKQWDTFNVIAPTVADFWEFLPIFAEAAGFVRED